MVVCNAPLQFMIERRQMAIDESLESKKNVERSLIPSKNTENIRVCLPSRAFRTSYTKAHADSSLVAHVPDATPRPRGLHVTYMSRDAVVAAVHK